jgi:hypothetical protein
MVTVAMVEVVVVVEGFVDAEAVEHPGARSSLIEDANLAKGLCMTPTLGPNKRKIIEDKTSVETFRCKRRRVLSSSR